MRSLVFRVAQWLRMANYWLVAQAAMGAMALLRLLPMNAALGFADRAARMLGPLFGRHRVALDNLRKAYPEKSEDEIRAIALDMWGNMARLAAEYVYLDQLFDYDPAHPNVGRIEAFNVPLYEQIASEKKAAYHLHGASRQFRADPDRRRNLRAERHRDVPAAEQPLHRQVHSLDAARPDGRPDAVAARRLDRACPHPRSRRQYRRAGRPVVPERRQDHLLRPAVRDQPADPQACPAVRLRRLSGALHAPARQPLPHRAGGEADAAARCRGQGRRDRDRAAAQRRGRALGSRGPRPVDVVPQALEAEPAAAPTGSRSRRA